MKLKCLGAALALLLMLSGQRDARAQYSADPGSAAQLIGSNQKTPKVFGGVTLVPVAAFGVGGHLQGAGTSGTQTKIGQLIDVEVATIHKLKSRQTIYQLGGWYWNAGNLDLYEIHARVQAPGGLGFQVGYINTSQGFFPIAGLDKRVDAAALDMFVLYRFSSYSLRSNKDDSGNPIENHGNWSLEFGAGLYIDTSNYIPDINNPFKSSSAASANYTFYANGSYQFGRFWSVQLSEWILRDRFQDLNRVALGIGYRF